MSLRDFLGAVVRRWYVVLGVLLASGAVYFVMYDSGGVYVTKPIVAFFLPGARALAADNGVEVEGVIAFASSVAESVNEGKTIDRYAADDAPPYGAGATEEVRIGVPDVGGQWGSSFTRAEVAVSVVGRSEAWVKETQRAMIQKVLDTADAEQELRGVPPESRIESYLLPLSTSIERVGSSTSQRIMAFGALMLAGSIVGCWLACIADRKTRRLRKLGGRDSKVVLEEEMTGVAR